MSAASNDGRPTARQFSLNGRGPARGPHFANSRLAFSGTVPHAFLTEGASSIGLSARSIRPGAVVAGARMSRNDPAGPDAKLNEIRNARLSLGHPLLAGMACGGSTPLAHSRWFPEPGGLHDCTPATGPSHFLRSAGLFPPCAALAFAGTRLPRAAETLSYGRDTVTVTPLN